MMTLTHMLRRVLSRHFPSLVFLFLATSGGLEAADIIGSTHQAVVEYYGKPASSMKAGSKEVLIYPEGRIVLVNDQVTQSTVPYPLAGGSIAKVVAAEPPPKKRVMVSADHINSLGAPEKKPAAVEYASPSAAAAASFRWPLGILGTVSLISLIFRVVFRYRRSLPAPNRQAQVRKEVALASMLGQTTPPIPEPVPAPPVPKTLARAPANERDVTPPPFPISTPLLPQVPLVPVLPMAPGEKPPSRLTVELMQEIEWRRFEEVVAGFYRATGTRPELTRAGANGGLDLRLYRVGENRPYAFVQCKAWVDRDIDEKILENTVAIMGADGIERGVVITPRAFTPEAIRFAAGKPLEMLDGQSFLRLFNLLSTAEQESILREATRGDYRTPTCPQCGQKMVQRDAAAGREWYCTGFPHCHAKPLKVRGDETPTPAMSAPNAA